MTDDEKAAAVLGMVEQWLDCDECDSDMAIDMALALDLDELTFNDSMRAELRRLASVLRGDAVGAGPAAPDGVRKNCWTCRWNDVEDGNACLYMLAEKPLFSSVDEWQVSADFDDDLMPHPSADGCPGWGQR